MFECSIWNLGFVGSLLYKSISIYFHDPEKAAMAMLQFQSKYKSGTGVIRRNRAAVKLAIECGTYNIKSKEPYQPWIFWELYGSEIGQELANFAIVILSKQVSIEASERAQKNTST